ncbi:hypothetical protein A5N15_03265 [Rothia kristinae]|uniref:Uncharacterized protein n=1 Tax=Rothia kristinae TaxID=37923 RepID=A0A657IVA3_9MICC|nr:hypothetical protein A5N15_03265 [Rothia kristinae]
MVRAHEQVGLADLQLLRPVPVGHRVQHEEQGLPVALQLGPLVALHRVLHREFVEVEHAGGLVDLLFVRVVQDHRQAPGVLLTPDAEGLVGVLDLPDPALPPDDGGVRERHRPPQSSIRSRTTMVFSRSGPTPIAEMRQPDRLLQGLT